MSEHIEDARTRVRHAIENLKLAAEAYDRAAAEIEAAGDRAQQMRRGAQDLRNVGAELHDALVDAERRARNG